MVKTLTTREFQIVEKLLRTKNAVRIKDVSEEFCVSDRTIKNDLENVKSWFREQEVNFHAQPNKGIWIECLENERIHLHNKLTHIEKSELFLDQNVRVQRIIGYLLSNSNYVTAQMLADYLNVSRNTVLNDLNQVEEYIDPWQIYLERKQRAGYRIIGEEKHLRFLCEHILKEEISHYDLYQINMYLLDELKNRDLELAIPEEFLFGYALSLHHVRRQIMETDETYTNRSDLITLLIKLMVSIMRLNLGFSLGSYRLLKKEEYTKLQKDFVLQVVENVFAEAELPLLESEFIYISQGMFEEIKQIDLAFVTKQIIKYVSNKERIDYESDLKLYSNLLGHLSLRIHSGTTYRVEINPFAEEINKNHPTLVQAIKEACQLYIGNYVMLAQQSFITFIALHFLVSNQNKLGAKKQAKTLYVCATGHGVARLIKNKVEKEIPGIDIFAYCSIMEVNEICKKEQIDLIISVLPIEANVPVIVVNPIPTKSDLKVIKKAVGKIVSYENRQLDDLLTNGFYKEETESSEMISQEIIVKGYEVYQDIVLEFFNGTDEQNKRNALMMHIFLMVHRCYFDKQYDYFAYNDGKLDWKYESTRLKLREILEKSNLRLNDAELVALLQYFQ
ncbi:BglG family transcription antiterminator [Gottfriedia sp. NPDC056225]|uniref:BglG family transcription antiterminator n=1 Tax=Gottfriedia sp. NPDC056225 TaxID=3345751 RepID=UPI0015599A24|nr:HTH domain-containing protein [Arthrobacter citreus]